MTCGLDGPKRPGDWRVFVANTADAVAARGFVVTYDYRSGEGGRASEMSVKLGNRVENYQIETSEGRVRRPHGAYRSFCSPPSGEGQPIQRTPPPAPAESTTCDPGTPDATEYAFGGWPLPRDPSKRFVFVAAKVNDRAHDGPPYCPSHNSDPRAQIVCPFWPEGHAKRADCERKHGLPVWFGAAMREDNPFSADADGGASVTVCRASSCSDPSNRATCSACSSTVLP
jgi:hypothetical protein